MFLTDAESLFDNVWMTTKFDFSSNFQVDNSLFEPSTNLVTNYSEPLGDDVLETTVEFGSSSDSITSQDTVSPASTSSNQSASKDCPTSPEQHVPNIEMGDIHNLQIDDIIAWVELNGKLLLNESEVQFVAGTAMEDNPSRTDQSSVTDQSPVAAEIGAGMETTTATPQPSSTGTTKTPEQKQRKRLQNRNAATRYRCKKRSAQEALNSQCAELEDEQKMLSKKVEALQQETECLKKLIVEVFQKKAEQKNEQKKTKLAF